MTDTPTSSRPSDLLYDALASLAAAIQETPVARLSRNESRIETLAVCAGEIAGIAARLREVAL